VTIYGPVHWPGYARPDNAGLRDVLTVPPSVEPVTLEEAKAWGSIQNPDDDPLVSDLIVACRRKVEADLGQAFITQTRTAFYSGFPGYYAFRVPRVPLQSVVAVKYLAFDGTLTTVDTSIYSYAAGSMSGAVQLKYATWWPIPQPIGDAVQVEYTCGYGDAAADVPMEIRLAIRQLIAANYGMRESHMFMQGGVVSSTPMYDDFLNSARMASYG
jgi:uncharacterized phiE125 gp8 family phage protein